MASSSQHAYCTLLMTDSYLPGAMVLAHSLRDHGTQKLLAALVTLDSVSSSSIEELKTAYDLIVPVDRVVNRTPANLYLMDRPDLASAFTKIALWRLTQFSRIVYVDADVVALRAPDELFDLKSRFAAAPDVGWPDCFNTGVMALTPNMQDYYALQALASNGVSFDGADQGLLNTHFSRNNWERISFTYNCTPSGNYQYAPAYRHFGSQIHMIHFIGREKPWLAGRHTRGSGGVYGELLARWWAVYDAHYRVTTTAYKSGQETSNTTPSTVSMPESISEKAGPVERTETGKIAPAPRGEQRRFSAPHSEWDPTRQPPPAQSLPEASNFPIRQYLMSEDPGLFQPPRSYPEPPRDMYYEVPKERLAPAAKPKPIFPWEVNQAPASRVFAEDKPPSPEPEPPTRRGELSPLNTQDETSKDQPESASLTPTIHVSEHQPFSAYTRSNAWDEMPEIQRYMEGFALSRRGGRRPNGRHTPSSSLGSVIASPEGGSGERRPSLRLTDFPTEVERPSLPVTPAPIRRPTFWGEERDNQGELPAAEGVPAQHDWDPFKKLEELQRRQSETFISGTMTPTKMPQRELPGIFMAEIIKEEGRAADTARGNGLATKTDNSTDRGTTANAKAMFGQKASFFEDESTAVKREVEIKQEPTVSKESTFEESKIKKEDSLEDESTILRRATIEEEPSVTEEVIVREGSTITKQFTYKDGSTAVEQYTISDVIPGTEHSTITGGSTIEESTQESASVSAESVSETHQSYSSSRRTIIS